MTNLTNSFRALTPASKSAIMNMGAPWHVMTIRLVTPVDGRNEYTNEYFFSKQSASTQKELMEQRADRALYEYTVAPTAELDYFTERHALETMRAAIAKERPIDYYLWNAFIEPAYNERVHLTKEKEGAYGRLRKLCKAMYIIEVVFNKR